MKSLLSFQIFLHLGAWYFGSFCLAEVLLNIYKYVAFPNTFQNLFINFGILVLTGLLETLRIFTGWKGNLVQNVYLIGISIVLIVPGILGVLYIMLWQIYVVKLEVILCSVQLTLQGIQLIFAIISSISIYSSSH
nr:transmembrane protein 216-like [Lepeophtheirus salmonis]